MTASTVFRYSRAKRQGPGNSIGIAREDRLEGQGSVMTFIRPGWYGPQTGDVVRTSGPVLSTQNSEVSHLKATVNRQQTMIDRQQTLIDSLVGRLDALESRNK